jgi:outer membrane beta-barrel protein
MRPMRLLSFAVATTTWALALLLLAPGVAAAADETQGIDLRAPAAAPAPPPKPAASPTEKAPAPATGDALEAAVGVPGERDTALEDRVKAVQRKGFLKQRRFQLTAFFAPSVNDAFYQKYGFGGRLAYNIQDSFAVALSGTYYMLSKTSYVRQASIAFQSQVVRSQLYGDAMLEGVWSPIYGKAAWIGKSIVHFDVFLLGGLGVAWSATSFDPRNEGMHPAADVGIGMRFYPLGWMGLELGLSGTFYVDQASRAVPATIQSVVTFNLGVNFFLPTRFEYVYP